MSIRESSRILVELLVKAFVPEGEPSVVGADETLERRREKQISAKVTYRDPLCSPHYHFVKIAALRFVCLALPAPVAWACRV